MAFDVSALTNYVKEDADLLFTSSLFSAKTQSLIKAEGNVMVEVKSAETVNIMDTDAIFQDNSGCGFNASGTTTFSQRVLTVGKIKVQEDLCPRTLESKYLQKKLPAGSMYTEIAFSKEYTDRKAQKVAKQLEIAIWQGDTNSVNANLNKFDGFQKLIANAAGVIDANPGNVTPLTSANIMAALRAIKNAIPADVMGQPDIKIFAGWDVFNMAVDAHVTANLFNYGDQQIGDGTFMIPGTTIKLEAVHGLDGTGDLYAMRMSNMFFGTDMLDEEDKFDMWYSQDQQVVKFSLMFKAGVQVAFPSEIVKYISSI